MLSALNSVLTVTLFLVFSVMSAELVGASGGVLSIQSTVKVLTSDPSPRELRARKLTVPLFFITTPEAV